MSVGIAVKGVDVRWRGIAISGPPWNYLSWTGGTIHGIYTNSSWVRGLGEGSCKKGRI